MAEAIRDEPQPLARQMGGQRVATIIGAAVVLYVAQGVFLPLAIAMLIAFALSPLVTRLRRTGLPMLWTVLAVVAAGGCVVALFAFIVFGQLAQLAENVPTFRGNIIQKVESLKQAGGGNSLISRLSDMAAAVSAQVDAALPGSGEAARPMPVEVVTHTTAYDLMTGLVLPLLGPVANAGLVIILVVFMLLERDQLRERFIRLVGSSDLHRTTEVLEEAGLRVGTYLLTQLLVNVIYAVPITLGLWLIGVPNALLWGMLTLVLRFVPYIGAAISSAFPLCLAFAVSPGWSMVVWTGALFLAVEFITSNIVEPWLYGSRTGVSPLAIIISALFWTFLWGPLGLVLSTPLTVCLVVLGRHIPQFDLFDILLGDAPVLAPHARLYQRLLSGDRMEATFRAEEALEDEGLAEFYQTSAIPALLLAQDDRDRGVLLADKERRLAETASGMVEDLTAMAAAEDAEAPPPDWRVTVVGGRWDIDDSSAAMLAQVLVGEGALATAQSYADLAPARIEGAGLRQADCLILCFLDPTPSHASLLHIRRIKRLVPGLRVGVVIWDMPVDLRSTAQGYRNVAAVPAAKLAEAMELGADFAVVSIKDAVEAAFETGPAVAVPAAARRPVKLRSVKPSAVVG